MLKWLIIGLVAVLGIHSIAVSYRVTKSDEVMGIHSLENFVKNPGFEQSVTGWGDNIRDDVVRISSTNNVARGNWAAVHKSVTSSHRVAYDTTMIATPGQSNQRGVATCMFKTTDALYDIRIVNVAETQVATQTIPNGGGIWAPTSVYFTFPATEGVKLWIIGTNASANEMFFDDCSVRLDDDRDASFVTYAVRVANSGTPSIPSNQEIGDWVDDFDDGGTGLININITPGAFSGAPVCTCTPVNGSDGASCAATGAATATDFQTQTRNNANSAVDIGYIVMCHGPR